MKTRFVLFVSLGCAASLHAGEVITCKSPDGKFAMHCVSADAQPYAGETSIVESSTRKNVLSLDPKWTLGQVKLIWSPDSQRVAYFAENGNDFATRIFFRNGASFHAVTLPELPSPKIAATEGMKTRVEPMQWLQSGDLLVEKELINSVAERAALKITVAFNSENRATVRSSEPERVSIIDYFLLLPKENFEVSTANLLNAMRTGSEFYLCDGKVRGNVDEKNGYLRCAGDGAQPSFEVALFRYRDGKPLLALCSDELEAEDSSGESVYLKFFEMNADGKMHEVKRSIFPNGQSEYDPELGEGKGNWKFEIPREGRTVVVRAKKSGKLLHRFAWDGEKFQNAK